MLLDHRAAQAQAEAHAFGSRREEGREELDRHFGRHARAGAMLLDHLPGNRKA